MTITEKLNLQQQLGGLVLFREGVFLRAYNESCYILTALLANRLKVQSKQLKCLDNHYIVMSVFPAEKLYQRLPNATLTEFGAIVTGHFDLSGYHSWLKQACRPANGVSKATFARKKEATASAMRANYELLGEEFTNDYLLPLNHQQLYYLLNWQKGVYPIEVDLGFIDSLKQKIKIQKG